MCQQQLLKIKVFSPTEGKQPVLVYVTWESLFLGIDLPWRRHHSPAHYYPPYHRCLFQEPHPLWLCVLHGERVQSSPEHTSGHFCTPYRPDKESRVLAKATEIHKQSSQCDLLWSVPKGTIFFSWDAKAKSWLLVINKNPILNILQGESSYPKGNDSIFLRVEVLTLLYSLHFSLNYC